MQICERAGKAQASLSIWRVSPEPLRYAVIETLKKAISCKLACALGEDSDQPAHPRSLIRVFAVSLKTL